MDRQFDFQRANASAGDLQFGVLGGRKDQAEGGEGNRQG